MAAQMANEAVGRGTGRTVGLRLAIGILVMPYVFFWFLLRSGHSRKARLISFAWMIFLVVQIAQKSEHPTVQSGQAPSQPTTTAVDKPATKTATPRANASKSQTGRSAKPTGQAPADASVSTGPTQSAVDKDTRAFADMEQRITSNATYLDKYYATQEMVSQSSTDVLALTAMEVYYGEPDRSPEAKALAQKAAALLPRAERQSRQLHASALENILVKNGMDVDIEARGPEKDELHITYALMSKPMVYQFQNELKVDEQAISFGYKRIVYTNGFESSLGQTWSVTLDPK